AVTVVADDHRGDLPVEAALRLGPRGTVLRLRGELVEVLPAQPPLVGDHLRGEALVDQVVLLGQLGRERRPGAVHHRAAHGDAAHALDAGGDGDVADARGDQVGGEVHSLLRGPALAIDGGSGNLDGIAREQHRLATDVDRLLAHLGDTAEDDVLDGGRVDARAADHLTQDVRGEVDGVHLAQVAVLLVAATQRGAHRLHDDDIGHAGLTPNWTLAATIAAHRSGTA